LGFPSIIGKETHLKLGVVLQKRTDKVGLIPSSPLLEPIRRIFKGEKYLVDVNQYPRFEPWQDFE
jgi:hypothetical protein